MIHQIIVMLDIVCNNPFRVLGVWSNARQATIFKNQSRMKAFLNVEKAIELPTDMVSLLPTIDRNLDIVQRALAAINLPSDKIRYALFWFCNASPIDEAGLSNLVSGDSAKAHSLFSMKESYSSLVNRAVLSLILSDVVSAVSAYSALLHNLTYREQFIAAICGDTFQISEVDLSHLLFDELAKSIGAIKLLAMVSDSTDKEYVTEKAIEGSLTKINNEIAKAKGVQSSDAITSFRAGKALISNTRSELSTLRILVGTSDVRFISASDNLAKQVLQCGINYFNNSDDKNSIDNALELQEYALSIAVGNMARDRCQKNIDILLGKKRHIAYEKDLAAIASELKSFQSSSPSIARVRSLVNTCIPHLNVIMQNLGASDDFYLKVSSAVANNALGMLIDVVNQAQDKSVLAMNIANGTLYTTLDSAVNAMEMIGQLDMNPTEKSRFYTNDLTLISLKAKLDAVMNQRKNSNSSPSSSGCYIATMVYGDYDEPQVMVLRDFRDNVLRNSALGRLFIRFYYRFSPTWVEHLKDKKHINSFIRVILDKFISIYKHEKN